MNILHIWNTASVASLMVKHLRRNGIQSDVIARVGYDPFNTCEYYGTKEVNMSGNAFINYCIEKAKGYDIIHVHNLYKIGSRLRKLYPNKKIILQHHGTEVTNCNDNNFRRDSYKFFDHIICSTEDLYQILKSEGSNPDLISNAVDTDLFKPKAGNKMIPALFINMKNLQTNQVYSFVNKHCEWEVHQVDRENSPVLFSEMPAFLNMYDKYIDVKICHWTHGKPLQATSKTAREALACGLSVLNYKGEIISGLPVQFTPEYMVDKLIHLYES